MNTKRFILTGAPGSGKTAVIRELEKLGHAVVHEAATDVIAVEQKKFRKSSSGNRRPWDHPHFIDKIIVLQMQRQSEAKGDLQFYDRSPFCTYALAKYMKYEPSPALLAAIDRSLKMSVYRNKVFFFENLGFIEPTEARKISYEEALVFEHIHLDVYKAFGFELVLVPKKSIEERCEFILDRV